MWKQVCEIADAAAYWIGDRLTDITGHVALRVPLEQADGPREVTLNLPGYPPEILSPQHGRLKTGLEGWVFRSFTKTQYAGDPRCGGLPNFLKCHLSVIAMLDKANELGCLGHVHDESGFWEKRDLQALVREIGSWNEMIAAFGGLIKDLLGVESVGVESAISRYPNFERLEAAGQQKLRSGFEKLAKLIRRAVRETGVPGV